VTGYGVTLKESNSKYKFRYNLSDSTLIFQFLCTYILIYIIFALTVNVFKNKKRWKNKKTLKTCFYRIIKKRL